MTSAATGGKKPSLTNGEMLAVYGLFKQAENGDLTDEGLNERKEQDGTVGPKLAAYLKQRGKSKERAMAEYITLVATSVSIKLKMTMFKLIDGTIETFNYECKSD